MTVIEPGFQSGNFRTEPMSNIAIGMDRDADLALLHNGMNVDGSETVRAHSYMHLGVRL